MTRDKMVNWIKTWHPLLKILAGVIITVGAGLILNFTNDTKDAIARSKENESAVCILKSNDKEINYKADKNSEKINEIDKESAKRWSKIETNLEWIRKTLEDMKK